MNAPPTRSGDDRSGEGRSAEERPDEPLWIAVCPVAEVPDRHPVGIRLIDEPGVDPESDRSRVCVTRHTGPDGVEVVQGMLDRCPHRDIALSAGIVKDGLLTCPGHFWQFDLADGRRTDLPEQVLTLYPTLVEDGWVWVQLPPEVPARSMREWLLEQARAEQPRAERPLDDRPGS
ncbi:MAG: Rieske (2Fe-2S) protein [Nocardioides sp.]